ncbi:MAG: 30S ribosomal protein S2 [Chitinophagales bacterium]|jgi:small subunit ribosomal protein S2|nr:30S ribosomal protein S2 [Chitinophagales bacterium]
MTAIDQKAMLDAGVHFGHLKKKWNPKMLPYIYAEKKGIHLIDLNKTAKKLEEAGNVLHNLASNDKKILFIATKKQAKEIVKKAAIACEMPYVTERWLGGMLTNFTTIRKSIKKLQSIDKMFKDNTVSNITKKERLMLSRTKEKLENELGGISQLVRVPDAVFIVDINHENIAILESHRLKIPVFGIVDTNSDPNRVDYAIPGNDDSAKSIEYIINYLKERIVAGRKEIGQNTKQEEIVEEVEEIKINIDEDESDKKVKTKK